eukprot:scaffold118685_cov42-Phaeocystis_antarctica.AAC.2
MQRLMPCTAAASYPLTAAADRVSVVDAAAREVAARRATAHRAAALAGDGKHLFERALPAATGHLGGTHRGQPLQRWWMYTLGCNLECVGLQILAHRAHLCGAGCHGGPLDQLRRRPKPRGRRDASALPLARLLPRPGCG